MRCCGVSRAHIAVSEVRSAITHRPDVPKLLCIIPHHEDPLFKYRSRGSSDWTAPANQLSKLMRCMKIKPHTHEAHTWRAQWAQMPERQRAACRMHTQIQVLTPEVELQGRWAPEDCPSKSTVPVQRVPLLAKMVQRCDLVAASALHGIILADSLQIPSVMLGEYLPASELPASGRETYQMAEPVFKYHDYCMPAVAPTCGSTQLDLAAG